MVWQALGGGMEEVRDPRIEYARSDEPFVEELQRRFKIINEVV